MNKFSEHWNWSLSREVAGSEYPMLGRGIIVSSVQASYGLAGHASRACINFLVFFFSCCVVLALYYYCVDWESISTYIVMSPTTLSFTSNRTMLAPSPARDNSQRGTLPPSMQ
eukprot:385515-Ditylum_brightwellii.AAC.1